MKITGGNNNSLTFKVYVAASYLAAFSPFYLKFITGATYLSGFVVGCLCSWGFNNIYNKIAKEEEKNSSCYQSRKRTKIKKMIKTLKEVEKKKKMAVD